MSFFEDHQRASRMYGCVILVLLAGGSLLLAGLMLTVAAGWVSDALAKPLPTGTFAIKGYAAGGASDDPYRRLRLGWKSIVISSKTIEIHAVVTNEQERTVRFDCARVTTITVPWYAPSLRLLDEHSSKESYQPYSSVGCLRDGARYTGSVEFAPRGPQKLELVVAYPNSPAYRTHAFAFSWGSTTTPSRWDLTELTKRR